MYLYKYNIVSVQIGQKISFFWNIQSIIWIDEKLFGDIITPKHFVHHLEYDLYRA